MCFQISISVTGYYTVQRARHKHRIVLQKQRNGRDYEHCAYKCNQVYCLTLTDMYASLKQFLLDSDFTFFDSGEGIPDLLLLLVQWTQKTMVEKLTYSNEIQVCFLCYIFILLVSFDIRGL